MKGFATALATRYDNKVRHWQVWNEPNSSNYLRPQRSGGRTVSPKMYRRMVNAFAAGIHGVNSNNVVVAGGLGPFGHDLSNLQVVPPLSFMRSMLCVRGNLTVRRRCKPSRFDIWAMHPYTHGGPNHHARGRDDVSIGDLPEVRRVLETAARGGKIRRHNGKKRRSVPFWVTEFSWDTRPPDPQGVPTRLHARWVSGALYWMWRAGVSQVTWFKLEDQPVCESYYQSGLYTVEGRRKASLQAFRFPFVAFASNGRVTVWGRTPDSAAAPIEIQRRTADGWRTSFTLRANSVGIFERTVERPREFGFVRARLTRTGEASQGFSLAPSPERSVNPFGKRTLC